VKFFRTPIFFGSEIRDPREGAVSGEPSSLPDVKPLLTSWF